MQRGQRDLGDLQLMKGRELGVSACHLIDQHSGFRLRPRSSPIGWSPRSARIGRMRSSIERLPQELQPELCAVPELRRWSPSVQAQIYASSDMTAMAAATCRQQFSAKPMRCSGSVAPLPDTLTLPGNGDHSIVPNGVFSPWITASDTSLTSGGGERFCDSQ